MLATESGPRLRLNRPQRALEDIPPRRPGTDANSAATKQCGDKAMRRQSNAAI
jgi:hypothetical protein